MPQMSTAKIPVHLRDRVEHYARLWRLTITNSFETETSLISYATRDEENLLLKLIKRERDEWNSGAVLAAFEGKGLARLYEHEPGAVLVEHLQPGTSLVQLSLNERDDEATDILAGVIEQMPVREAPAGVPTNTTWARGFERYLAANDGQIQDSLVETAQQVFLDLVNSQRRTRLLHGDLQHYNVLFDSERGWQAIDPKGVMGELEYEIGAILRNPVQDPEFFLSRPVIERRLMQLTSRLALNYERTVAWAFAQAVLSAIWEIEDGSAVDETNSSLRLAQIIQPMISW